MNRNIVLLILSISFALMPTSFASFGNSLDPKEILAARVKEEFLHAWNGYKEYAWGHDELKPVSKHYRDWYSQPLYISVVEALDTMLIMGLQKEADEAREFIAQNLNFDHDIVVQVFEVNIRVLGGLLSGYQLSGDERLLALAKDLGNRLLPAFSSKMGMPYTHVNLRTGEAFGAKSNPAEAGSYILEFGTLSALTGNPTYFNSAKKALVALYRARGETELVGSSIDVDSGKWLDKKSHIGGGIDSYYEYLYKCAYLFDDEECRRMWVISRDALHYYLEHSVPGGLSYGRANLETGILVSKQFSSLDAFFAGLLALDGDLDRAEKLQDAYFRLWKLHSAMPESYDFEDNCVLWAPYFLRPEVIESTYYLYKMTGNNKYIEMGRRIFEDLVRRCRVEHGYSGLDSVEPLYWKTKNHNDQMESFFLAETLKYLYLLFAPAQTIDLKDVVFNTEAHPIRKSELSRKSKMREDL